MKTDRPFITCMDSSPLYKSLRVTGQHYIVKVERQPILYSQCTADCWYTLITKPWLLLESVRAIQNIFRHACFVTTSVSGNVLFGKDYHCF